MNAYDAFRARCDADARAFDRAAERARSGGDLYRARACSEQAIRLRYLAEFDADVAELFNAVAEQGAHSR